jgi:hypothetical protein
MLFCRHYSVKIGITFYGLREVASSGCNMGVLIGKMCKSVPLPLSNRDINVMRFCESIALLSVDSWNTSDQANCHTSVTYANLNMNRHFGHSKSGIQEDDYDKFMIDQCQKMMRYTVSTDKEYSNIWIPEHLDF